MVQRLMTLERGSLLNNRYRIVEILGQGGMGSIYRAIDENLGLDVAVKENLFTTEEYARQFRREAVILANLRHPHLPRVTDHFVIDGRGQYLVMDYIEGEDLRERIDREGVLNDADAVVIGAAICDALTYLHTRQPQVVHRDIKPGNVKISPNGNIVLVDFGLVKVVYGSQATTTGARAMTPGYSPPEQYGTGRTDQRTDIYSLGASLYVALTGVMPEDALARAMEQTELTPIRKQNTKVSRKLAGVIEKALEIKPEDRFQSAEDFKQALFKSRVITGRRQEELTVTPPPASSPGNGREGKIDSTPDPAVEDSDWPASTGSPLLAAHTPISGPAYQPRSQPRRGRRVGCLLVLLLLLLFAGGTLGAVYYQPALVDQGMSVLGAVIPALQTPTQTNTATVEGSRPIAGNNAATPTENAQANPSQPISLPASPSAPAVTRRPTQTPRPTETPIPTSTPVGGGKGQIAFASDRSGLPQIWLMNAGGTGHKQITEMDEGACQPSWSPDGGRLVFISPCAFNQEIYPGASLFIINADGTNLTPLPTIPGGDFDPVWSPDGTRIAFTSVRDFNRAQIYVINLEDETVRSLSANKVRDSQPTWHPDGSRIAFISTRRGPFQIWTMKDDGTEPEILSRSGSLKNTHPVWAPDGQLILFTQSEVLGGVPRLVAGRFDGETYMETKLVPDATPMREGAFSPDGFWLAYESWPEGGNHDIFIMTPNGMARQNLTDDPAFDFDPAWRPASVKP
jgi:serine/threonine protein kinase